MFSSGTSVGLSHFVCTCLYSKKMIDEDDHDIKLLQEQFLQDGDLHSDGFGRMRRFRWQSTGELA